MLGSILPAAASSTFGKSFKFLCMQISTSDVNREAAVMPVERGLLVIHHALEGLGF